MTTITKEQAQKIIEAADDVISAIAGDHEDVSPDSDGMLRLWDDLNDRYAPPEVVRELARIALASLEAEPVAWTNQRSLDVRDKITAFTCKESADGYAETSAWKKIVPLYTAPPAPVSVPDAIHSQGEKSASDDYYALGWNACRAAMLQEISNEQ